MKQTLSLLVCLVIFLTSTNAFNHGRLERDALIHVRRQPVKRGCAIQSSTTSSSIMTSMTGTTTMTNPATGSAVLKAVATAAASQTGSSGDASDDGDDDDDDSDDDDANTTTTTTGASGASSILSPTAAITAISSMDSSGGSSIQSSVWSLTWSSDSSPTPSSADNASSAQVSDSPSSTPDSDSSATDASASTPAPSPSPVIAEAQADAVDTTASSASSSDASSKTAESSEISSSSSTTAQSQEAASSVKSSVTTTPTNTKTQVPVPVVAMAVDTKADSTFLTTSTLTTTIPSSAGQSSATPSSTFEVNIAEEVAQQGSAGSSGHQSSTDSSDAGSPSTASPSAIPTVASSVSNSASPSSSSASGSTAGEKAGLDWNDGSGPDGSSFVGDKSEVGWFYTWNSSPLDNPPPNIEFIPMLWGTGSATSFATDKANFASLGVERIFSFNEPDIAFANGGSDIDVATAVKTQTQVFSDSSLSGYAVSAPALSNTDVSASTTSVPKGMDWLGNFTASCQETDGCRYDFFCIHWYGLKTDDFRTYITNYKNRFLVGKDADKYIMVTEYGAKQYNTKGKDSTNGLIFSNQDDTTQFHKDIIEWFGSQSYIHGWSNEASMMTMASGTLESDPFGAIVPDPNTMVDSAGAINQMGKDWIAMGL